MDVQLSTKEQKVFDYIVEQMEIGKLPTIGEICKACRTTPKTLLGKTMPRVRLRMETQNRC